MSCFRVAGLAAPIVLAVAAAMYAPRALATEAGTSLYLLGSGGPEVAIMPPLQGVFMNNQGYYYNGGAQGGKDFVVGGKVVAGLNAQVAADFLTVLWVPTTNTLGGATFAVGGALPVGDPMVHVSAVVTGPGGNTISLASSDSAFVVGDPLATAALGWKTGDLHIQLSTIINIPIGDYREGALANLAFHRWAKDGSLAATWHNDKSGWDLSGKAGFTFNGTNTDTDYKTGTEFTSRGRSRRLCRRNGPSARRHTISIRLPPIRGAGLGSGRSRAR